MKGSLEDLSLSDILYIVFLSKRTGILILGLEGGKSSILFKNGGVVSVHTDIPSPGITEILAAKGLLPDGLYAQLQSVSDIRTVGRKLRELGIPETEIEQSAREQIIETVKKLLDIREGTFSFELIENLPVDGINPEVISLSKGVEPDEIVGKQEAYTPQLEMPFRIKTQEVVPPHEIRAQEHYAVRASAADTAPKRAEAPKPKIETPPPKPAKEHVSAPAPRPSAVSVQKAPLMKPSDMHDEPEEAGRSARPVILVDDEALFRIHLESNLKKHGFRVYATESAGDALAFCSRAYANGEFPVVISDLLMHSSKKTDFLGGLEVLEEVRKLNDAIPVILMANNLDSRVRHAAYRAGVSNYLIKPDIAHIDLNTLETDLEQFSEDVYYIVRRLMHEESAPPRPTPPPSKEDIDKRIFSEAARPSDHQLSAIRALMAELQSPSETTEISLLVLRLAAEFFDRGVLFLVKHDKVYGLGGFGETGEKETMNEKVKLIQIERSADSVFKKVIDAKQTHRGKLKDTMHNRLLIASLGKLVPTEVILIPLISRRKAIAILYGDNAARRKPVGNIEGLEIFMSQAGIAMENALLYRQLQEKT